MSEDGLCGEDDPCYCKLFGLPEHTKPRESYLIDKLLKLFKSLHLK